MNRRLWSGVMAGIMAVSSSIVLELPAAAQDYELMQTTLGDWQAQGQTIALGGIATSSSTIRITCTAPAGLTEDVLDDDGNKTGETKTPEEVCGIILDNDWSNKITVAYDSETGVSTHTLTYDQFSGKRNIAIQNHTHSDIQVTVEAVDFEEDTREAPSTAAITDNIALTISTDDNSGWLEGNIASTSIPDSVLTERFKGKTVGEFRAAVGKVYTPAVNYISDTAGAGKDAFVKMFYIGCDNAQFTTSDAQMAFALDEEGVTFTNGMFPDDSNDGLIIEEIGTSFETACEWDGDINKNRTKSEVLNALPKGYNLFIETTEDDKETLELPAASGTITMGAYTDENNSWLYGASAGGSFTIESVDGITYGTTTMKEFRDKYKYIKLQDLPFFASSIESLTGDQLNQNVGFEFADGSYLGLRSSNTNLGNLYGIIPDGSDDDISNYDDKVISKINIDINVNTNYDEEKQLNVSVNSDVSALSAGDKFTVELTEDTRSTLDITAASGEVDLYAFIEENSDWYEGVNAGGFTEVAAPEGITYGKTTLKQLMDGYKTLNIPEVPFFSCSLDGVTADDLMYTFNIRLQNGDDNRTAYYDASSLAATNAPVDGMVEEVLREISNPEDYVISGMNFYIRPKNGYNSETDKHYTLNEAIKALNADDVFTVVLTQDTRGELSVPAISSASAEMYVYTDDSWLEGAAARVDIAVDVDGIESGKTTIKDLREKYKAFNAAAQSYYGDSVNAGADAFVHYVKLITTDPTDGNEKHIFPSNRAALTSDGVFRIDDYDSDGQTISSGALDSCVIERVELNIETAAEYDESTGKSHTTSEAIRGLSDGSSITLEFREDTRGELSVPAISEKSTEMYVFTDDSWLDGSFVSSHIAVAVDGIVSGQTTVKTLRENYKTFSAAAQTYYTDSVNAGADAFVYKIKLEATDPSDKSEKEIFAGNAAALTSGGKFSVDEFECDGQSVSSGAIDDYVINRVMIVIEPKTEYDESTGKSHAVSEAIRGLSDGSHITLEFREDTRKNVELEPIASTAYMYTRNDENAGGMTARADYEYSGCKIIGKTVSELLADYKSVSIKAPGYFADSVGAKADAYNYRIEVIVDNDEGTDTRWLNWYNNALDEDFTLNFSTYYSILEGKDDYKVTSVKVVVEAKNGENGAVSEIIRSLPENSLIVLEFKEDTRAAAKVVINPYKQVYASYQQDDNTDGACAHASMPADEFSGEYVGMTLAEFKKAYKTLSTDKITFTSDTEGYSAEDYTVKFYFVLEKEDSDDVWRFTDNSFGFNTAATSYTDMIDESDTDGYKIAEIGAFVESRKEETEDGKLRAVNEKMRGGELNTLYIINPQSVKNLKATAGDKTLTLIWDAVDFSGVSYKAYIIQDGERIYCGTSETNSVTVTDLENDKEYTFAIGVVMNETEYVDESNTITASPRAKLPAPSNVKAAAGDKQITVTWDKLDGAVQYRVQRLNGTSWGTVATTSSTSYTNTGLVNGQTYSYRVLASDGTTWGVVSEAVSAAPKAGTIPQNVKATAGDKQVTITWSAVENATQYRVQRLNNSTWGTVANVTSTSYTNTGLTNGASYSYRVLALVDGKWSSASAAVSAKPAAVSVPQNVKATAGDKKVTVTWSAFSGATQYRVQRLNNSKWGTVANVTSTSYTNTGLTNGTSYSYRVLAYANGKWTSASAVVSAKPAAPTVPQNVKATAGDKKVTVTWSAFSGATQYRVQRLNNSKWGTVANVTSTSYTNTGLTNGTSYSYRVLAYANGKWTSASAAVSAKPAASVPQNVKATAGDKKVTVTWSALSGATQYRVQRLNNSTWGTVANVTSTSYTNTGLTNGTAYSYRVLAYVNGKWTSASAAVSATPKA